MKTKLNFNTIKSLLKKNKEKRPILNCINYRDDKIVFTDSYSLVEISTRNEVNFLLNVETLTTQDGNYPNTDSIKRTIVDLNEVKNITMLTTTTTNFKNKIIETYNINGYPFDRKQVDTTFKTIGKNLLTDIELKDLQIKEHENHGKLVYQKDNVYILILGRIK